MFVRSLKLAAPVIAAGSLMAFATWWLENGMPYSAAQMDEMFQELTRTA